jgi:hypothetical protein
LTIRSAARRNRNLTIEGPDGTGLFLKQPDHPAEGGHETLRREAEFHRFCRQESAVGPVGRIIPPLIDTDETETVLVFQLVPQAISFRAQLESQDQRDLTVEAARALGRALGTVHRVFGSIECDRDPRLVWLPRALPWAMRIHRPVPGMLASLSPANAETLRILQTQGGLEEQLERLCAKWRSSTVIHGDIRFDNVLIQPRTAGQEPGPVELWLADWEMVQIGDPAWDLAGAFQDFLVVWVSTMPLSDELTSEERIAQASVPLPDLRRAARALWSGYRQAAPLDQAEETNLLPRAVAYSAARLIQSAFELADGADRLPGQSVILLQIAANLLAEPERGQLELYGIPLC